MKKVPTTVPRKEEKSCGTHSFTFRTTKKNQKKKIGRWFAEIAFLEYHRKRNMCPTSDPKKGIKNYLHTFFMDENE